MSRKVLRTKPHNPKVNHGPNIPADQIAGPFPAGVTPSRTGPYKRESPRTKKLLWSYWNGRTWSLMGKDFDRMLKRRGTVSGHQSLPWFGMNPPAGK